MEQTKMIKVENIRPEAYGVNYPMPDGFSVKAYNWMPATKGVRRVLEVPEYVYTWMLYDTTTFQEGYLVLADTDEEVVNEFTSLENESLKVFSVDEIKKLLEGDIKKLKKEVTKETPEHIIGDFINVAKSIKLDSSSKKKYLAGLIGRENEVAFVFAE